MSEDAYTKWVERKMAAQEIELKTIRKDILTECLEIVNSCMLAEDAYETIVNLIKKEDKI